MDDYQLSTLQVGVLSLLQEMGIEGAPVVVIARRGDGWVSCVPGESGWRPCDVKELRPSPTPKLALVEDEVTS